MVSLQNLAQYWLNKEFLKKELNFPSIFQQFFTFWNVDGIVGRRLRSLACHTSTDDTAGTAVLVTRVAHGLRCSSAKHVGHFVHHTSLDNATHVTVAGGGGGAWRSGHTASMLSPFNYLLLLLLLGLVISVQPVGFSNQLFLLLLLF